MAGRKPDESAIARLKQMEKWQRNFRVTGAAAFKNTADGCSMSIPAIPPPPDVSAAELPVGEFEGQYYGMVAQNVAGFSFIFAIDPVE